jgi:hypothetical protein
LIQRVKFTDGVREIKGTPFGPHLLAVAETMTAVEFLEALRNARPERIVDAFLAEDPPPPGLVEKERVN